jgi:DNA-directed RNA polymerase subunit N (RpoN/RPB10)
MTSSQGLGIDLLPYIRCPTCGKVLANLHEPFVGYMKKNVEDANSIIPRDASYIEAEKIYNNRMAELFDQTMEILGVKRYCCKMHLLKPQQILAGAPPPVGNIAVTKYNLIDGTAKRNPTRIELTKKSKVPGGSNMFMMSMAGYEETITPGQWVESSPYMNALPGSSNLFGKPPEISSSLEKPGGAPEEILRPFVSDVPMIETGGATVIKRKPKLKNVRLTTTSPGSFGMDIEKSPQHIGFEPLENKPNFANNDFMELDQMTTTFRTNLNLNQR